MNGPEGSRRASSRERQQLARERHFAPGRRLFVAVPLPDEPRRAVVDLVDRVRNSTHGGDAGPIERHGSSDVRWVRLEGLHLTLRFLGPTEQERVPAVEEVVRAAAQGARSFEVRLAGAGAFPNPDRPRALWVGVVQGVERLSALASKLDEGLVAAGWPPEEREYRAHLTLARSDGVRSGPRTVRQLLAAARDFSTGWRADRIVLYESHTGRGPASYEALLDAPLEE